MKHLQLYESFTTDLQTLIASRKEADALRLQVEEQWQQYTNKVVTTLLALITTYGELSTTQYRYLKFIEPIPWKKYVVDGLSSFNMNHNPNIYIWSKKPNSDQREEYILIDQVGGWRFTYEEITELLDLSLEQYPEFREGQEMGFFAHET